MKGGTRAFLIIAGILLSALVLALAFARPLAFAIVHWKTARKFPQVQWATTGGLALWMADTLRARPLLLDARTEPEFAVSHLEGAQRIDPYYPSFRLLKTVPLDSPIVVYSSVGYRSARVTQRLAAEGFIRVRNLQGGIFQWANERRPLVGFDGRVTLVHPYSYEWGLMLKSRLRITAPDLPKKSAAP